MPTAAGLGLAVISSRAPFCLRPETLERRRPAGKPESSRPLPSARPVSRTAMRRRAKQGAKILRTNVPLHHEHPQSPGVPNP